MLKSLVKNIHFGLSLFLIALAIGIVLLITPIFGNKSLIVRSGSMMPTVRVGDLIVVKGKTAVDTPQLGPLQKYQAGDVIAFKSPNNAKVLITHRIVGSQVKDNQVFYHTKGDANNEQDNFLVAERDIIGKGEAIIPYFGKLFAFAKTKNGFLLMVVLPAALVMLSELSNIIKELKKQKSKSNSRVAPPRPRLRSAWFFKLLIPLIATSLYIPSVFALLTDTATSTDNTFSASTVFPGAAGSVVINEIMWSGSSMGSDDEWIELRNMTSSVIDLSNWVVEKLGTAPSPNITIPSGNSIGPNGFFLISNDPKSSSIFDIDPDYQTASVSLDNDGEQLVLKNNTSAIVDTANGLVAWYAGSNSAPRKSMERNSTPGDGTLIANWHTASTQANLDIAATESATPKSTNGAP